MRWEEELEKIGHTPYHITTRASLTTMSTLFSVFKRDDGTACIMVDGFYWMEPTLGETEYPPTAAEVETIVNFLNNLREDEAALMACINWKTVWKDLT